MDNYKKITLLKGDKVLSALEIKKKRHKLVYCKKLLKSISLGNGLVALCHRLWKIAPIFKLILVN